MHPIDRELELIDRLYGGDSRYGASSSRYVKDQCEIEPTDSVSSIGTPALSPVRTASRSHMCNVPAHRLYDVEMGLEHNNHGIPLHVVESYTTPNRPMRTVLREKILKHYRGISRCEALLWILCILYMVTFIYGWMNQKALASSGAGGKLTDLLLKPEDVPNE